MHVLWDVPSHVRRAAGRVPTRHDRSLVEQALARYAAGECRRQIAQELVIRPNTLTVWVQKSGLARHNHRPGRLSNREIAAVVETVRACGSIRSAARQLGRDESTVRFCLRRHAPDMLCRDASGWRPKVGDPLLDVEPLAQLLDAKVSQGFVIAKLAADAGTKERRVNAIRNREYKTVRLSTADRICIAAGTTLSLVYPDDEIRSAA